jgi:hypothetical protein
MKFIKSLNWSLIWTKFDKIGWVAFLFFMAFLPITSFPFFPPAIGGGALVRPLSLYPLLVIIPLVILPRLFSIRLPREFLALGAFVVVVVLTGIISLFRETNPASNISSWERVLRATITLGLGTAYYLAVALTPKTIGQLRTALGAMYVGFTVALAWGSFQLIYVLNFSRPYFKMINELQGLVSTRRLFENRISGMTYEPNWFAEQITLLLIPWLLASLLSGTSVLRLWKKSSRWHWLTIELFLLLWAIVILLFTYSRAGLLNFAILLVVTLLIVNLRQFRALRHMENSQKARRASFRFLLQLGAVITVLASAMYFIGTKNAFFTRLWGYWQRPNITIEGYLTYLGFEARLVYGEAAYNMYLQYPLFGVGPGNYALHFAESLPYKPLAKTPEVLRLVTPDESRDRLVTAKNFPLRLLAETGILGLAAFIAFFVSIFSITINLLAYPGQQGKFWGLGALLSMVAFIFSTLSFDSFALPNMWVAFGLITAANLLVKIENSD